MVRSLLCGQSASNEGYSSDKHFLQKSNGLDSKDMYRKCIACHLHVFVEFSSKSPKREEGGALAAAEILWKL